MGRQKKFKAVIENKDYYEDLIWMSYRYCIGRSTITAASHAGDIARYSFDHLSDDRREFNAMDIRREINDSLRFIDNIHMDYYGDPEHDALSLIIYSLIDMFGEYIECIDIDKFNYKVKSDKVEITEDSVKNKTNLSNKYFDLIPWIKLANSFDKKCHRIVVTEYEGRVEEHICFPYPQLYYNGKELHKRWVDIEKYRNNPSIDSYISPEYIKEIREINETA